MLTLTRESANPFRSGTMSFVTITAIQEHGITGSICVRIGIDAPDQIKVFRSENTARGSSARRQHLGPRAGPFACGAMPN